jgi:hypothetical protein
MGRGEVCTVLLWGDLREGNHLDDAGIDGRIILRQILSKWNAGHGLDLSDSG